MAEADAPVGAEDEIVDLLVELIRINTTSLKYPERPAAEWVAAKLGEVGIPSRIIEAAPGRASTIARIPGSDGSRPPLLVHGHLDVVPADASEWAVDPFAGEVKDGCVWGRGAVDMKNMDAMMLAVARDWARKGVAPERDVVLAFLSDEEAGGREGSLYLVSHHGELFSECAEAIGEVGGFSISTESNARLYPIQTAEKGITWLRLRASGRPGHGSLAQDDNALTRLASAISRIGAHQFPTVWTSTAQALRQSITVITGDDADLEGPCTWLPQSSGMERLIHSALRNSANPTMFSSGYYANVVPSHAEATIDARFLPGQEEALLAELDELIGEGIEREVLLRAPAVEAPCEGALIGAMSAALQAEDPGARVVPFLMSSGTDAKAFAALGMRCYGFCPLLLPADLDFMSLFHGIDERVPIDGLRFGVRVLGRLLQSC